ncbi:type II toxin-antitoxin system VapC family toxin [Devosia geojensis]|nr:type II toxin-antitoxin system VapC family toxin [Devosia geojensis]
MIVVDSSLVMTWYLEDEVTPATERIFDQVTRDGAVVPSLWRLEIANAFRTAIRKNRMTSRYRDESLADLQLLDIVVRDDTHERAWTEILALSDRHGLTPYDASYLELALRERLPLASLDKALLAAARAEGLETLP